MGGFKKHLQMESPNLTWMVFIFGLIHGFGLSTRLQQLPLGEDHLVLKILSFNVGVELGQIIALTIMLVILAGWRKTESFNRFSKASNVILMILGGLLLLMQLHGYQHSKYSDDFPLNKDYHSHTHEDMESAASELSNYPVKLNLDVQAPKEKVIDEEPASEHSHDGQNSHKH